MPASRSRGSRKGAFAASLTVACVAAVGGLAYLSGLEAVAPRGSKVAGLEISGLTRGKAEALLSSWWDGASNKPLRLDKLRSTWTAREIGLELDVVATLDQHAWKTGLARVAESTGLFETPGRDLQPVLSTTGAGPEKFAAAVEAAYPKGRPARVTMGSDGVVKRVPEEPGWVLDESRLEEMVLEALAGGPTKVPIVKATQRIADEDLLKIVEPESEFTTRFSAAQTSRSANIRIAASKLDGHVLAPGERLSFNETVGKRTKQNGFQLAGIYLNGRHDFDIGGGICQVSTTLYNAALIADLAVPARYCHSLPVPYVPIGRDAAVSFPLPDLVIENTRPHPVAISASYKPGRLTFRILGIRQQDLEVEIERQVLESWMHPVKYVHDAKIPPGTEVVIEKGGSGHKVRTYRLVKRGGVLERRDSLGLSHYKGGPKIIATNRTAPPAQAEAPKPEPEQDVVPPLDSPPDQGRI